MRRKNRKFGEFCWVSPNLPTQELGLALGTVHKIAKENNVYRDMKFVRDADIISDYQLGLSLANIADKHKVSITTVRRVIKQASFFI